jgi:hypothetical protein
VGLRYKIFRNKIVRGSKAIRYGFPISSALAHIFM